MAGAETVELQEIEGSNVRCELLGLLPYALW